MANITPVHQFVCNDIYSKYNYVTDVFENIYKIKIAKMN